MSAAYASAVGSLGLVELTCIPEALDFRQPPDARKAFIFEPPKAMYQNIRITPTPIPKALRKKRRATHPLDQAPPLSKP